MGLIVLIAELVEPLVKGWQRKRSSVGVLIAALALCSVLRTSRFKSDATLWAWEVANDPSCKEGHSYLALHAWERGDAPGALAHGTRALAIEPRVLAYVDRPRTEHVVALALADLGRDDEALEVWAHLEGAQGQLGAEAAYMSGVVLARKSECHSAGEAFDRAEVRGLDHAGICDATVVRALCAWNTGDPSGVRRHLERYDAKSCTTHESRVDVLRRATGHDSTY